MWFRSLFDRLSVPSPRPPQRCAKPADDRPGFARRLVLEGLEDRRLMAFDPAVSYLIGDNPAAVVAADFNGDGTLDLATAQHAPSEVIVLLGNPDGTFQTAQNLGTGSGADSLAVGDFNADGKLDLATDGDVLLGNGDGTFQAPLPAYSGTSVVAGDLNADGMLDLVVGGSRTVDGGCGYYGCNSATFGEVSVLLGHGDGTFLLATTMQFNYHFSDVALADLNGDGKLDVAVTGLRNEPYNHSGALMIFLGTGDGGLYNSASYITDYLHNFTSVAAADVNSDGNTDLFVADSYWQGDTIRLFMGNGDGTFQASRTLPSGDRWSLRSLAVADFDRDGRVDVAAAGPFTNEVHVLLGKGDGNFRDPVHYSVGSSTEDLAVGDFNGDGFPDLATANNGSDDVSVLLSNRLAWGNVPEISISDVSKKEGKKNQTTLFMFTVTLSAASDQPVTMSFRTVDGTTTSNSDYVGKTGTLTFAPGQTTKTITIEVKGDSTKESNETFYLDLFGLSSNAHFTKNRGIGTILNDD